MSVIVHGTYQGDVVYETPAGEHHTIPVSHLSGIQHAIDRGECSELDPCANCHDAPGTEPMEGGVRFCPACCSAATGPHDDHERE